MPSRFSQVAQSVFGNTQDVMILSSTAWMAQRLIDLETALGKIDRAIVIAGTQIDVTNRLQKFNLQVLADRFFQSCRISFNRGLIFASNLSNVAASFA